MAYHGSYRYSKTKWKTRTNCQKEIFDVITLNDSQYALHRNLKLTIFFMSLFSLYSEFQRQYNEFYVVTFNLYCMCCMYEHVSVDIDNVHKYYNSEFYEHRQTNTETIPNSEESTDEYRSREPEQRAFQRAVYWSSYIFVNIWKQFCFKNLKKNDYLNGILYTVHKYENFCI